MRQRRVSHLGKQWKHSFLTGTGRVPASLTGHGGSQANCLWPWFYLPPFSVCSYLFTPRFQAVIQVLVPDNVYFCQCLLLFHNVSEKNCARLIIKCRNTGNWEEVYQSSTINQLDIKCAIELHLDTWGHIVYQIELLPLLRSSSFWWRRWLCVVIILEECVHASMTILLDYVEVRK